MRCVGEICGLCVACVRHMVEMCDLSEVQVSLKIIDTFNGGNLESSYKEKYGTESIPCVQVGLKTQQRGDDCRQLYQFLLEQ